MDLTSAIIGHLIADYLLQFDFIAENKKKEEFNLRPTLFYMGDVSLRNG